MSETSDSVRLMCAAVHALLWHIVAVSGGLILISILADLDRCRGERYFTKVCSSVQASPWRRDIGANRAATFRSRTAKHQLVQRRPHPRLSVCSYVQVLACMSAQQRGRDTDPDPVLAAVFAVAAIAVGVGLFATRARAAQCGRRPAPQHRGIGVNAGALVVDL